MSRYSISAILSGVFFGLTGLFTRTLTAMGLSTMGILVLRCAIAAVLFFLLSIRDLSQLKIRRRDLPLFLAVGILGQGMFSFCYYNAINMMSISSACILMYLSPVFVTILAWVVFKDRITRKTVLSIALCVVGCILVSGFDGKVTPLGILCGVGSAVAFALINILDRILLNRGYTGTAVNFWICVFAALFGLIVNRAMFSGSEAPFHVLFSGVKSFLVCAAMAVTTGFLSYRFFSLALGGMESGKVSILASSEPVTETLVSILVFKEPFGFFSVVGILFVLGGIVLQNRKEKGDPKEGSLSAG